MFILLLLVSIRKKRVSNFKQRDITLAGSIATGSKIFTLRDKKPPLRTRTRTKVRSEEQKMAGFFN